MNFIFMLPPARTLVRALPLTRSLSLSFAFVIPQRLQVFACFICLFLQFIAHIAFVVFRLKRITTFFFCFSLSLFCVLHFFFPFAFCCLRLGALSLKWRSLTHTFALFGWRSLYFAQLHNLLLFIWHTIYLFVVFVTVKICWPATIAECLELLAGGTIGGKLSI